MKTGTAIKILLCLSTAVIIFHLLIIFKVIPYTITWGGRLKNDQEMYVFEVSSIFINLLLVAALLFKARTFKFKIPILLVDVVLWIFLSIFILNTIANLFAKTDFEKSFSLLTLIFAILIGVVLKNREVLKAKQ
jgi:hypothetical protein